MENFCTPPKSWTDWLKFPDLIFAVLMVIVYLHSQIDTEKNPENAEQLIDYFRFNLEVLQFF